MVSESGIETKDDIDRLSRFADGFLIGTTFLQSTDPEATLVQLTS